MINFGLSNCHKCKIDILCSTNDVGIIRFNAKTTFGKVSGVFKSTVDIRGLRFANGMIWYAGDYEVGSFVIVDGEFFELVNEDAETFFKYPDINSSKIALLNAIPVSDYQTLVAAVAYIGGDRFIYSSKLLNLKGFFYNSNIQLPDDTNLKLKIINKINTEETSNDLVDVTNVTIKATKSTARKELYKVLVNDLKKFNICFIDNVVEIVYNGSYYFITDEECDSLKNKCNKLNEYCNLYNCNELANKCNRLADKCSSYKIFGDDYSECYYDKVDLSNIFSPLLWPVWRFSDDCLETKIPAVSIQDESMANPFYSFNPLFFKFSYPGKDNTVITGQIGNKSKELELTTNTDANDETDYFLISKNLNDVVVINYNILFQYGLFKVSQIPKETLFGQTDDITIITSAVNTIEYVSGD